MIIIEIELKDRSRTKEFFHKLHNKSEDMMFSIIQKLPDKFIPSFLISWMGRYTDKRINELQRSIIKDRWTQVSLEKVVDKIQPAAVLEKAPSGK